MKTWLAKLGGGEFKVMRLQECATDGGVLDAAERAAPYIRRMAAQSLRYNTDTENLMLVALSARRHPIGFEIISNGTLDTLLVHPREVFKSAVLLNASAIIIAHNHPSGDPTPGEADIKVTRDLIRAGQLMRIEVLDHIILGTATGERIKDYTSLRELGYFYT